MNGLWIAALVVTHAVTIQVCRARMVAGRLLLCCSRLTCRGETFGSSKRIDYVVLPMVDLLERRPGHHFRRGLRLRPVDYRPTRAHRYARIVALDRFDADYIEEGGQALERTADRRGSPIESLLKKETLPRCRSPTGRLTAPLAPM